MIFYKSKLLFKNLVTVGFGFIIFNSYSQIDTTKWEYLIRGKDTVLVAKPNAGDNAYDNMQYSEAIIEYKKLLVLPEADKYLLYYSIACCYSKLNLKDSAFLFLYRTIETDSLPNILCDPDFYNLINDKRWYDIENIQLGKVQIKNKLPYKDEKTAKMLWRIKLTDQVFYSEIDYYEKRFGQKNRHCDSLWALKAKINSKNVKEIEKIIREFGWPKYHDFGYSGCTAAFLVIQHADEKLQKKYLPLLELACKEVEASWQDYALMYDRIQISENKPQLYGSQVRFNETLKKYELLPLEAPEYVDKRRKEKNMQPLADYLLNWDIKFNIEQKQ